jgi:hypothetical protein
MGRGVGLASYGLPATVVRSLLAVREKKRSREEEEKEEREKKRKRKEKKREKKRKIYGKISGRKIKDNL